MSDSIKRYAVVILLAVFAMGCSAGKAVRIPLTMPDGSSATIVAHDQQVPDYWLDADRAKLNFMVKGNLTESQLAAVLSVEKACRIYTDTVTPNDLVAVVSGGVIYAVAGFIGVGAGSQALTGGLSFLEYGAYGAAAGGMGGVANAFISNRSGRTYTFQNCGREALGLFSQYEGIRVLQKSPW